MAENTKIQWCDATFNPWEGCTKHSPGCANCYAEARAKRLKTVQWGAEGTRRIASESSWRKPLQWDREAAAAGVRRRVFCGSLMDVFEDRPELIEPRCRLLSLIRRTPNLDWLLLTKRPEGILDRLQECGSIRLNHAVGIVEDGSVLAAQWFYGSPMPNIWLGVSVEDQQRADQRIPILMGIPATVRFLSMEPLLGPVTLFDTSEGVLRGPAVIVDGGMTASTPDSLPEGYDSSYPGIDWVIVGGESGHGARPCELSWIRSIVQQCREAQEPVFVKQLGARAQETDRLGPTALDYRDGPSQLLFRAEGVTIQTTLTLRDKKGGDMDEWPEDLRIREFPSVER